MASAANAASATKLTTTTARVVGALLGLLVTGGALAACGGERLPPKELVSARAEYGKAQTGITAQLDPADVREAKIALDKAESAWNNEPDDRSTIDLALVAERKAQIAEAEALALKAQQDVEHSKAEIVTALQNQKSQLAAQAVQTQAQLAQTQEQLKMTAEQMAEQKRQLADMEAKLKDARDTIAKIAAVKDDDRGMVITLQGEVLFRTGQWDLKAGAMAKLDQIAEALRGKEQPMIVYGFTDNVGTRDTNMELSQKRAQSVRDYLAQRGIPGDLITAQGKGPDSPIGDNSTIEGRAQNRRVEIVVQPKKS